ncbi:MAG: response regulator [Myxococcota bacterium]
MAKVLCVDDEPRVLDGLELHLGMEHELFTATSGALALETLGEHGPFDVVVSDMRMPGMDGAALLTAVRERFPSTMRILLTGHADLTSALRAVNEGQIFRFLTKPCDADVLLRTVDEACELNRLRRAEQELLEKTLRGCVEVLTEVLGVAVPIAWRNANRLREIVRRIGPALGVPESDRWQVEVVALLTRLGSIAVPNELLERVAIGQSVTAQEEKMLAEIPSIGARLIGKVPRLEDAAELVRNATATLEASGDSAMDALRIALWIEHATRNGRTWERAVSRVRRERGAAIADVLGEEPTVRGAETRSLFIKDLRVGMHICDDVCTVDGQVVVRAGTDVTDSLAARLHNFARHAGLQEPIRVRWAE